MSGRQLLSRADIASFPGRDADRPFRQRARRASPSGISSIRSTRRRARRCRSIPPMMTSSPINLHIHGVHVSPKGNADNVMLHIPAGMSNTYTYHIPKNMPQGAYWYHSHLHALTTPHVYYGLAGLLAIGRTDGNLPLVTQHHIPIRNMVLQYNYCLRSRGRTRADQQCTVGRNGSARSSRRKAMSWPRAPTVRCSRRSISCNSKKGTKYFTSLVRRARCRSTTSADASSSFRAICSASPRAGGIRRAMCRPIPSLPDYQARRAVHRQRSVPAGDQEQGRDRPRSGCSPMSATSPTCSVQLTETATGNHPKIAIVGQDGNPSRRCTIPSSKTARGCVIPPATRYAIAVTMPATGDLVLEMPPRGGGARTIERAGHSLHQRRHRQSAGNARHLERPAVGGQLLTTGSSSSRRRCWRVPSHPAASGATTAFKDGQPLDAYTAFEDISRVTPDFKRQLVITGGFLNDLASTVRSQGLRLCVRRHGVSQRSAAPAAARFGRGVELHQQEQRRASDPHPRQRLPGHAAISIPRPVSRPGQTCGASIMPTCRRRRWVRMSR